MQISLNWGHSRPHFLNCHLTLEKISEHTTGWACWLGAEHYHLDEYEIGQVYGFYIFISCTLFERESCESGASTQTLFLWSLTPFLRNRELCPASALEESVHSSEKLLEKSQARLQKYINLSLISVSEKVCGSVVGIRFLFASPSGKPLSFISRCNDDKILSMPSTRRCNNNNNKAMKMNVMLSLWDLWKVGRFSCSMNYSLRNFDIIVFVIHFVLFSLSCV